MPRFFVTDHSVAITVSSHAFYKTPEPEGFSLRTDISADGSTWNNLVILDTVAALQHTLEEFGAVAENEVILVQKPPIDLSDENDEYVAVPLSLLQITLAFLALLTNQGEGARVIGMGDVNDAVISGSFSLDTVVDRLYQTETSALKHYLPDQDE